MPSNRIRVERDWVQGTVKCEVWDKDGVLHDVTDIFLQVQGSTSVVSVSAELTIQTPANSLQTKLKFTPDHQELAFDVSEQVIDQILEMHG